VLTTWSWMEHIKPSVPGKRPPQVNQAFDAILLTYGSVSTCVCFLWSAIWVHANHFSLLSLQIIIIISTLLTYPGLSVGLSSFKGRKFILSPKVKGHVLGIFVLYDTFVMVLLFVLYLRCFWLN
jgi:hypothetical protein